MSATKFTPDQLNAIEARGGTVLVSAAAGSGKTAVLVERVIRLLTDPVSPVDADRLVVVTFTKAAAAEMRERIDRRIAELLRDDPDNMALRRQKLLLSRAHIDTIHSFCSSVLREFFARAGVAPDFRIADESEMRAIRAEALSQLVDTSYTEGSSEFIRLVELLGDERSDRTLDRVITELAEYVTAYPDPESKLEEFRTMYAPGLPVEKTGWGRWMLERAAQLADYALALNDRALDELTLYPDIEAKCRAAFDSDAAVLQSIRSLAQSGDWDGLYRSVVLGSKDLFASLRGGPKTMSDGSSFTSNEDYKRITAERTARKDIIVKKLRGLLETDSAGFEADRELLEPMVDTLCRMTAEYRSMIAAAKAERKLLDYDDLEHMTASLLFYEKDGKYYRTDTAAELSARYDQLLIDEYQDTNYTQDLIFRAISDEGTQQIGQGSNLFLVGDIKQSIYSFRKAVPQLFLNRLNSYPVYDPQAPCFPAKIILDRNFRSRPQVTEAVNFIFEQIMTAARGGITYNDEQRLVAGRQFPEGEGFETELHLLDSPKNAAAQEGEEEISAPDDDTSADAEARYCARLIRSMVGVAMVTDGDTLRPAEYRDFCIMRRGIRSGAGQAFARQFAALGVPVSVSVDNGFFRQSEVCVILSLLRAVDNPLLDISLAAALRSPIFGFDSRDLAALRTSGERGRLYSCLLRRAKEGDPRCVRAAELLEDLRVSAAALPCDRLIRQIYTRTGYLAAVQAMPGGQQRRGSLLQLLEFAAVSESTGSHGLGGFLRMMERMEDEDKVRLAAPADSNSVSVRTMHYAKGLQFPICIVTGMGGTKNNKILSSPLPIHERLGVGAAVYDLQRRMTSKTIQQTAAGHARYADELDEELRVLYVALTRAVDKLIMVSCSPANTTVGKMLSSVGGTITENGIHPMWLEMAASTGKWVTACALRHPDCAALSEENGVLYDSLPCPVPFAVKLVPANSPMLAPCTVAEEQPEEALPVQETVEAIARSMEYEYPCARTAEVPAKVTASQTHKHGSSSPAQGGRVRISPTRPAFMTAQGLTPTERGTALHRFMQFCDLDRARQEPAAEVERLVACGFLTQREGQAVDTSRVQNIFAGALGELMDKADVLHREWRFTARLAPERLSLFTDAPAPEEMVVLQGECDLLLIMDGRAVVVDYKTDRVPSTDTLVERYSDQLRLYADAVNAVTGLPVTCFLYSFHLSELRQVSLE